MIILTQEQKENIINQIPFELIRDYMKDNDWYYQTQNRTHYPTKGQLKILFTELLCEVLLFNGGWATSRGGFKFESKVESICTLGFYKLIKLNQPISLEGYNDPLWEITLKEEDYNISL